MIEFIFVGHMTGRGILFSENEVRDIPRTHYIIRRDDPIPLKHFPVETHIYLRSLENERVIPIEGMYLAIRYSEDHSSIHELIKKFGDIEMCRKQGWNV